jgi:CDP-diacylglycerol--glycerol-3-phosphate 3-phosphatidyltransferase
MLNRFARALFTRLFTPIARLLLRLGISPDVVTLVGTLGVSAGALIFFPRGQLFVGTMVIVVFVFSDMFDGIMARLSDRSSAWGAYLDSTLDRVGDAAVFGGLVLYFAGDGHHQGDNELGVGLALLCLVLGSIVSYSRARAEGIGLKADVGIAERSDRLVAILLTTGFCGWFVPDWVLITVLGLLALASLITIVQRILYVRQQALARDGAPPRMVRKPYTARTNSDLPPDLPVGSQDA